MNIWMVYKHYNAQTRNSVVGYFSTCDIAVAVCKSLVAESRNPGMFGIREIAVFDSFDKWKETEDLLFK